MILWLFLSANSHTCNNSLQGYLLYDTSPFPISIWYTPLSHTDKNSRGLDKINLIQVAQKIVYLENKHFISRKFQDRIIELGM